MARELPPVPERSWTLGSTLFNVGTVVTAGGSYGPGVLAEHEGVAAVGERGSGRFVGRGFTAPQGLEVRV